MINDALRKHIEESTGQRIRRDNVISGGDINRASQILLDDGTYCFLKFNARGGRDMFEKEARGLELLRTAGIGFLIPKILDLGFVEGPNVGYLLLEFISEGVADTEFYRDLGEKLGRLHKIRHKAYGLNHNNYIGRLPQSNTFHSDWISFFIEERLKPQLRLARDKGHFNETVVKKFDHLYAKLPELLPDEPPSLLHGDLWSGNILCSRGHETVLIDPAVYFGNREIELAFTQLFGSFDDAFYDAYHQVYPVREGFPQRKDIYNLYPLLVHTNLFGGNYPFRVQSIIAKYG